MTAKKTTKSTKPTVQPNANERAIVRAVDGMVRKYAKADAAFFADVTSYAKGCGPVTEKQWTAAYAPAFRASFDKHAPGVRDVMVNRVKIVFLCAANGITPKDAAGEPITALRPAAEVGRVLLAKAKVLPPVGTGKGAGKKGATGKRLPKKEAANSNSNAIHYSPSVPYGQSDIRAALMVVTGSPTLASPLAQLLANEPDARADLRKALRVFVDSRKA